MLTRGRLTLLLLALALAWFGTLDYRRLVNPDEGRYAEIAREMVASGDWVTPRLNDLKYFEKPPLQYWATASAYSLFGQHNWTARLWTALCGFCGALFAGFAAARLFGPTVGLAAGAVTASGLLWNFLSHMNTLDTGVSFFLSAAVFALCLAQRDDATATERQRWQDIAWVALALAVLSKGLIGLVLPGATVVAYALWQRDLGLIARIRPIRGLLILLLVTAPWFILVARANPEFAHFFFIHEHVERFLTKAHGRYQPAWYFIPILFVGMLPWLTLLPSALKAGWTRNEGVRFQPARFLWVWVVLVFAFFSFSSSKLPSYIEPILPALSVLIALHLSRHSGLLSRHALGAAVLGLIGLALVPNILTLSGSDISEALYARYRPWLYAAFAALAAGGLLGHTLARKGHKLGAILCLAAGGFVFGLAFQLGHNTVSHGNSGETLALAVRDQVGRDVPFYSVNTFDHSFLFYLGRTTSLVMYRDELGFGIEHEPQKFIAELDAFEKAWQAAPTAWALMPLPTFEELRKKGLQMTEMARDERRIIVQKSTDARQAKAGAY